MKWPIFRSDRSVVKRGDGQDQVEKLVAESLRKVGELCGKVADLIETQRLARAGYGSQDVKLRRLDTDEAPPGAPPREGHGPP